MNDKCVCMWLPSNYHSDCFKDLKVLARWVSSLKWMHGAVLVHVLLSLAVKGCMVMAASVAVDSTHSFDWIAWDSLVFKCLGWQPKHYVILASIC